MAFRYTTPQETEEIRRLYRTGEYSFCQLAEKYNLSKSTIINIVKGYPYGVYKQVYSKLQEGTVGKLEEAIKQEETAAQAAYQRENWRAYGNHLQRWIDLMDHDTSLDVSYETIKLKRLDYEQKAWAAFAAGEYEDFGYYAETWDILTNIIGDNAKNPWGFIPGKVDARMRSRNIKYTAVIKR